MVNIADAFGELRLFCKMLLLDFKQMYDFYLFYLNIFYFKFSLKWDWA